MGPKEDQLRQSREAQFEPPKALASRRKKKLPEKNLPPGVKKGFPELKRGELGFDREAYQREYMRAYMKDSRAAKKLGLSLKAYRARQSSGKGTL